MSASGGTELERLEAVLQALEVPYRVMAPERAEVAALELVLADAVLCFGQDGRFEGLYGVVYTAYTPRGGLASPESWL